MPGLFVLLIGIAIRSVTFPGADEGLRFMFTFRLEDLTSDMIVAAIGQAFFSLSVGMGILITYGSYLDKETDMVNSAKWICILDTFCSYTCCTSHYSKCLCDCWTRWTWNGWRLCFCCFTTCL